MCVCARVCVFVSVFVGVFVCARQESTYGNMVKQLC